MTVMFHERQGAKSARNLQLQKTEPYASSFKKKHKEARLTLVKKYIKTNFSNVLFTDKTKIRLDRPQGWTCGWVDNSRESKYRVRRRQGNGDMIWVTIIEKLGYWDVRGSFMHSISNHSNWCKITENRSSFSCHPEQLMS